MEELLKLSHDYAVEALKIYQILKSENNEAYLGKKIIANGIELGINVRKENSVTEIQNLVTEMKFLLDVICDADYLSRDLVANLYDIANEITIAIAV